MFHKKEITDSQKTVQSRTQEFAGYNVLKNTKPIT